jgi:hypothetical protein
MIKYEETTKQPNKTGISGKSDSQRFQTWRLVFTDRLRNYQKWCLRQRRAFPKLSTRKQINAPVLSGSCDFFLWGYVTEQVFVPPLPLDIDELKLRVTAASYRDN